ncbi:MAG: helix-turn-helix transcriptional regulator [Vicingus serpentipes]|nr:helix-turn-helix transcriptional regulator [Vicingus serpentipes]
MGDNIKYQEQLEKLSNNIKLARERKGMTKRELAERCEMEESNYWRFENPSDKLNPTLKILVQICEVLEVDLKDLL